MRRETPEAALFARLRLDLTLMYSAALAALLVLVGVALYVSLRGQLLEPVAQRAIGRALFHAEPWALGAPGICANAARGQTPGGGPGGGGAGGTGGPAPRPATEDPYWLACFDPSGALLVATPDPPVLNQTTVVPEAVGEATLVARALRDGRAWDVVDAGPGTGMLMRGATAVRSAAGQTLGVTQISQPVARELSALWLVRNLLLGVGGLGVALASGGGWLMASRALAPARQAFARQQAFVSDASHELRTPLTLMRANAELLLRHRERLDREDVEVVDEIVSETEHMSRLANDLLTLARLDAGKLELEREIVDLSAVARALVRRVTALAEERRITLQEDVAVAEDAAGNTRPLVFADPQYTEEAGLILVENAVKYTPAGGTVMVRTQRRNGKAALVVEDTGVGIPKEHLVRVGERFFRADASRSRETGGTGLGLAIAFRIARAHGGAISMESAPGTGTRATLSLPAATV